MPRYSDRLQIDYNSMVVPGLTGEGKESTFVSGELQFDLDLLEKEIKKKNIIPICVSLVVTENDDYTAVLGCTKLAVRYHFLLPWIEMKKRGIPKMLRTHPDVVAPMCENCYLLYDSKHRRLKTAWVKEAGLIEHKSPSYMRGKYEKNYRVLGMRVHIRLLKATIFLDEQFTYHSYIEVRTIGKGDQYIVTNIDTTDLRQNGTITITHWANHTELRDTMLDPWYETPM